MDLSRFIERIFRHDLYEVLKGEGSVSSFQFGTEFFRTGTADSIVFMCGGQPMFLHNYCILKYFLFHNVDIYLGVYCGNIFPE